MKCPNCQHEWAPYQKHSSTSKAAGDGMMYRLSGLRRKVYDYLADHPKGLTDEEIQDALAMNPSTQRPRRVELVVMNAVVDSGEIRETRSGASAVVWVARLGEIPPDQTPEVTVFRDPTGPLFQNSLFGMVASDRPDDTIPATS